MSTHIRQHEDSQGHLLPTGVSVNVLKDPDDLDGIDREVPHSFLCKKAEKLSAAVYMITGFLSDNEPMKWQIRESSLRILSDMNALKDSMLPKSEQHSKSIQTEAGRLASLFEIAVIAGFVSEMNLAILKQEYQFLTESVNRHKIGEPQGRYVFAREFFSSVEPSAPEHGPETENTKRGDFYQRQPVKDNNKIVRTETENKQNPVAEIVHNLPRREIILQFIKGQGEKTELSIKDIMGHVSGCGEKTVQRELGLLVAEGVLKKTGERRWSRYSLVNV